MKREIKYRIPYFHIKDNLFSHFAYWGRIDYKGDPSDDCFTSPGSSSHCYKKNDEQYTGFKDKNDDTDIYEGDILSGGLVVCFYNGAFGFWAKENSIPEFFMLYRYLGQKRVIGNIHNNPLLVNNEHVC